MGVLLAVTSQRALGGICGFKVYNESIHILLSVV
jgi:hypothetical protein